MNPQAMQEAMIMMEKSRKYDELIAFPERDYELRCSFCGKGQSKVDRMVTAKNVCICNECIEICTEIIAEDDHGRFNTKE
ncbi:ClpX C4-type zinc finger protein [Paenibacillus sp. CMAA1739]|uniref:ClpX C4-type zinc finger protein n=1 Tax=Paenibacillus ottowii TaxID=2315729 RepID=UPI002DBD732A|nr:ClpX C4-type zinc finger protein [Paenibacillus sp. CMAA1739]MEC4565386.1 ClpX C4-type zinc finger protein [Paenibacillus sp. CMAA1739]